MLKSSLLGILKTFSKEELLDFDGYLSSSYHNKKSIVTKLYKEIKKYGPAFTDNDLEKEKLWNKIYPVKKYNYGIMKNLIYDLKKLAEDYLSYLCWKKSSFYDKALINELWDRNAMELFLKKALSYNNTLEKMKAKDQIYYSDKLFVQPLIDEYNINRLMFNSSRTQTNDLLVKSFLMQYILNCFHLAVEMQKTKNKHDLRFLEYLLGYFKDDDKFFDDSPLLKIHFYLMLSFFDIKEDEYFSGARKLFKDIFKTLPKNEIKNIYNILILLCIFKINEGKNEYWNIKLLINIEVVNNNILSHRKDGSIELEAYRNIVQFASNSNEYNILKDFINRNKHNVITNNPKTIVMYSDAFMNFAERKYENCLNLCSKINFKDFWELNNVNYFFKCDVKLLAIRSHYELDQLETTLSSVDSFKHFLNNSKDINELNKKNIRSFLNFLNTLLLLRSKPDKLLQAELANQVQSAEALTSKDWLLEKIYKLSR